MPLILVMALAAAALVRPLGLVVLLVLAWPAR
jgi:hypothetical protein